MLTRSLALAHLALVLPLLLPACSGDDVKPTAPVDSGTPETTGDALPDVTSDVSDASDAPKDAPAPSSLELPGDKYFPESLHAAADGTLYVGSLGTGQVVKFAPGSKTSTTFIAAGDPKGVAGVFVDNAASMLWLCAADISATPPATEVRGYDLATATKKATFTFSVPAFCNDFALDATGNLFVADSFGKIWQLKKGATSLVVWKSDPLLAPSTATGFGADGLALDGAGNLFVNTFSDGRLVKIPIAGDGTAGTATQITVTPALKTPDAMRMLDATTLVMVDGTAGSLVKVAISGTAGTATTIASSLNAPTGVVKVGSTFWVSEGQLSFLFGAPGTPKLPFLVRAIPAP